jgi:hypothetical protein
VVEVAEELVEAMHRWQELIAVAQLVLAELAGGVAEGLERCVMGSFGHSWRAYFQVQIQRMPVGRVAQPIDLDV